MPSRRAQGGPVPPVRPFPTGRRSAGTPAGALFIDRQAGVIREICASAAAAEAPSTRRLRHTLDRVRRVGARIGVASHNRADNWDTFNVDEITTMNARIEAALGPIDLWCVCLVDADGCCACVEPASGVLATGARAVGIGPERCAVLSEEGRMSTAADSVGASRVAHLQTGDVRLAQAPDRLTEAADDLCRVVDAFLAVHELDRVRGPGGAAMN